MLNFETKIENGFRRLAVFTAVNGSGRDEE
jgi:hypothetical protein